MAGLRVVLTWEGQKGVSSSTSNNSKIINKATICKNHMLTVEPHTPSLVNYSSTHYGHRNLKVPVAVSTNFLDVCFLCRQELLPGKDVYMYKGDRGFCSTKCRSKQIMMDEEKSKSRRMKGNKKGSCSLTAMKKNTGSRIQSTITSPPPDTASVSSTLLTCPRPRRNQHYG